MGAEMERKFIRERQQAGIEEAKKAGVYNRRKPFEFVKSQTIAASAQWRTTPSLALVALVQRISASTSLRSETPGRILTDQA